MEQQKPKLNIEQALQIKDPKQLQDPQKSPVSQSDSDNDRDSDNSQINEIPSPLKRQINQSNITQKRLSIVQMNRLFSIQVLPQVQDILAKPSNQRSPGDLQILHQCFRSNQFFQKMKQQLTQHLYNLLLRDLVLEEYKELQPIFYFGSQSRNFYIILSGDVYILVPVNQEQSQQNTNRSKLAGKAYQTQNKSGDLNDGKSSILNTHRNLNNEQSQPGLDNNLLISSLEKHHLKKQQIQYNKKQKMLQHFFPQLKQNSSTSQSSHRNLNGDNNNNDTDRSLSQKLDSDQQYLSNDQTRQIVLDSNPGFVIAKTLRIGDCFGEIALSQDIPRTATCITRTECKFAVLSAKSYKQILDDYFQDQLNQKIQFVKQISLFEGVNLDNYIGLIMELQREFYTQNEIIYNENDESNKIYFIYQGQIDLSKQTMRRDPVLFDPVFQDDQNLTSQRRRLKMIHSSIGNNQGCIGNSLACLTSKQSNKKKRVLLASKTQFQWFGEVEAFNDCKKRFTQAQCVSPTCELYSISKKKFVENILSLEVVDRLTHTSKQISNWRSKFFDNQVVKVAFQRDLILNNFPSDKVAQQLINQKMKEKFLQNPVSIFQTKTKEEAKQTAKNIYFNQIKGFINKFQDVQETIRKAKEKQITEKTLLENQNKQKQSNYYYQEKNQTLTMRCNERAQSLPLLKRNNDLKVINELNNYALNISIKKNPSKVSYSQNNNQSFSTDIATSNKNINSNTNIKVNLGKMLFSPQNQHIKGHQSYFSGLYQNSHEDLFQSPYNSKTEQSQICDQVITLNTESGQEFQDNTANDQSISNHLPHIENQGQSNENQQPVTPTHHYYSLSQAKRHSTSILKNIVSSQQSIKKLNKVSSLPCLINQQEKSSNQQPKKQDEFSLNQLFDEIQHKTKLEQRYKILLDNSVLYKKDSKNQELKNLESSQVIKAKLTRQQQKKHKQIISLRDQFYLYEKLQLEKIDNADKKIQNNKNKFNQKSSAGQDKEDNNDNNYIKGRNRNNNNVCSELNVNQSVIIRKKNDDEDQSHLNKVFATGRITLKPRINIKNQLNLLCTPLPLDQNNKFKEQLKPAKNQQNDNKYIFSKQNNNQLPQDKY